MTEKILPLLKGEWDALDRLIGVPAQQVIGYSMDRGVEQREAGVQVFFTCHGALCLVPPAEYV